MKTSSTPSKSINGRKVVATLLSAASVLAFAGQIALELAGCAFLYNRGDYPATSYGLIMVPPLALSFSGLGFLIVNLRPENRIGWLCHLGGSTVLLGFTAGSYGVCGLEGQLALPAVLFMLWLVSVLTDVDLDQLTAKLLSVVDETMRPAHLTLWLNDGEGGERR